MLTCPDLAIDCTHGGQFLHLLWTIEEFINTLLNCGAKFEVVFFDVIWKVLCFRRLLISHLKRNTTQLTSTIGKGRRVYSCRI
jgi:EamA domain-containing membrane protein RarD